MPNKHTFAVISQDASVRAACARLLLEMGHAEPFDDAHELRNFSRDDTIVFAHDQGGLLEHVHDTMTEDGGIYPIIAVGEDPAISRVVDVVAALASDYLPLPLSHELVRSRLARLSCRWPALLHQRAKCADAKRRVARLTPRQKEVLDLLTVGNSNAAIGRALSISPRTVEVHRNMMMIALRASHTAEAVRIALESQQSVDRWDAVRDSGPSDLLEDAG
jgi:FixJ family two-component response regulator